MINNKKGFSFVELMMILIFFFIIMASLMPMITRRHVAPPQKVNHGTYACYWDGGELKETLVKGKKTIINNKAAADGKCNFEPPKKARYFYVQLIGGGGGGKSISAAELNKDEYKIKGAYSKEGGLVVKSGSPSDGGDWTGFLTDDEYKTLVGDNYIVLWGSSGDGEICTTGKNGTCGGGEEDGDPYCGIEASALPPTCPIPEGYTKDSGLVQHSCTPSPTDKFTCLSCPSINCSPSTPEGSYFQLTSRRTSISVKCKNTDAGKGVTCYKKVKMNKIGKKIITHSSWQGDASICQYIDNNAKKGSITRMKNGYGHHFYVGSENLLRICGGQGAQWGSSRGANPLHDTFGTDDRYCSNKYKSAKSAVCIDYSNSTYNADPKTYLYPDVGIYKIDISQSQEIPYGIGGRAGELKTLILKEIPENLDMRPGRGGDVDKEGEDTIMGPTTGFSEKVAKGGAAGTEIFTSDVGISPYYSGTTKQQTGKWRTFSTEDMDARSGGKISYSTFVKFVISYSNKDLKKRIGVFGQGGQGAATKTTATCGYLYQPIVLQADNKEINNKMFPGRPNFPVDTFKTCNGHNWVTTADEDEDKSTGYDLGYYSGALTVSSNSKAGETGAIVISW